MPLLVMMFVMVKQTLLNVIMMVEIVAPSFYHMDRKGNMYELTLNKKSLWYVLWLLNVTSKVTNIHISYEDWSKSLMNKNIQ